MANLEEQIRQQKKDRKANRPARQEQQAANKRGANYAKLDKLASKLGVSTPGYEHKGEAMYQGGGRDYKLQKKYMKVYDRLTKQEADLTGYGSFDIGKSGDNWNPYESLDPDPGVDPGDPGGDPGEQTPGEQGDDQYQDDPYGPSVDDFLATLGEGMPTNININTESGARAMEVLYPFVKQIYNMEMDKRAVGTQRQSLQDYKDDPTLNAVSSGIANQIQNPYTFDDKTVNLMQNRVRDQAASDEAALGERLRSMGVTMGTDSPAYASMAQQASMVRDLNRASMERDLDIRMASQRKQDEYRSLGLGAQFGGAYQGGLGQRHAAIAGQQAGGKFATVGNPFGGLWQGMLMENELGASPGFASQYGQYIAGGMNAGGNMMGGMGGGGGGGGMGGMMGGGGGGGGWSPSTSNTGSDMSNWGSAWG